MDLDYAPSRYKLLQKIGEGVHGVVIKAIDLQDDNKMVAIKKVALKNKYGGILTNTIREIKSLQQCEHENIVSLLNIYPDLNGLALVFEFMPQTLYSKLRDEANPLTRQETKSYSRMLIKGIRHLHELRIMHRDIKPANLLVSGEGILKIADFGLARLFSREDKDKCYSPQVSTRWYRAPEILWGSSKYGPAIDMWAVGCVFAEMLRGVALFPGNTDIEQLALVVRTLGTPTTDEWPELESLPDYNKIRFPEARGERWPMLFPSCTTESEIKLVACLVRYNPNHRLTAVEALHHEYFNKNYLDRY